MKKIVFLLLLSFSLNVYGQKRDQPSTEFVVIGLVKKELKFDYSDFSKFDSREISDVEIKNHIGEMRGTAKQLKGILVKDLLTKMELQEENPKLYSEFFLNFVASDGYKVVFSWNEIFNSPTGDNLYLITSRDGKELMEMTERILILTPSDFKTGRRHIKGLSKIIVDRVN
ncbi:hypothetical protein MM236_04490 [Belliella sp. DSM 107340]|uniref:Molybdopterin-binding protein n=1 Tax=Belliella calami TaxID=2923436 RepID=A0ABS9UKS9_9BACT|nr:hypothetical protein [Belliella calami]MCH7397232.1 hypothetical protein [Belliella calami]